MTVKPAQVTVAIEGWNADNIGEAAVFERSIESLRRQSFSLEGCEILLTVGSSVSQESVEELIKPLPELEVVPVAAASYYRMKNAALARASREYLVFADSDVRYDVDWLASMVHAFREGVEIVVGNTKFEIGFLHRALTLCDWAAVQPDSGFTDWVYGNNLALRVSRFRDFRYREDMGDSGAGGADVLRMRLRRERIRPWFCKEAVGYHRRDPFLLSRYRIGTYHVHNRELAPELPGAVLVRVPALGGLLVTAGTMVRAWQRAWRMRRQLPGRGVSLPWFFLAILLAKSVEAVGATARLCFPREVLRRSSWFGSVQAAREGGGHRAPSP